MRGSIGPIDWGSAAKDAGCGCEPKGGGGRREAVAPPHAVPDWRCETEVTTLVGERAELTRDPDPWGVYIDGPEAAAVCADQERLYVNNDSIPAWESRLAAGGDPAHAESDHLWLRAPRELTRRWTARFPFGHGRYTWIYARIGYAATVNECSPMVDVSSRAGGGDSFVVSALLPYAAYRVLWDRGDDGTVRELGVRYWAGLMHNFSFFVPPANYSSYFADGEQVTPYGTGALPDEIWDEATGRVDRRGRFVRWWTSLIRRLDFAMHWDAGGLPRSHSPRYSCDVTEVSDHAAYGSSYVEGDGEPSPLCFDDQAAADAEPDVMTSYLGVQRWGEATVCARVRNGRVSQASRMRAIRSGFDRVFGSNGVSLMYHLAFYSPDDTDRNEPTKVSRSFCVTSDDLESASDLVTRTNADRGTAAARYLFRGWDTCRLSVAAGLRPAGTCG